MAAMAGGLGVRLAKRGSYSFNAEGARSPRRPTSGERWGSSVGKALMVQGCTSHAGKSYLTAALCRLLADEGLRVAPFKAQNMSNNAGVTADGRELGRAQIVQARRGAHRARGAHEPGAAQARGRHALPGRRAGRGRPRDLAAALARAPRARSGRSSASSLHGLLADYDVVVIEGAGSPAEINLRDGDIVNMAVALEVAAPVLLCCDIDRGGAFAHLLGTWHCLARGRARRCSRASCSTASAATRRCSPPGPEWLEERTGVPTLGVVPWLHVPLPEEDGVALQSAGRGEGRIAIVVAARASRTWTSSRRSARTRASSAAPPSSKRRPRSSIPGHQEHAGRPRLAAHDGPGRRDRARAEAGVPVLGICGGLQMLGRSVRDPARVEGGGEAPGLGLLDLVTELQPGKTTRLVRVTDSETGTQLDGYEIHHGATVAGAAADADADRARRPARLAHRKRARELRARPAGARRLPRRAARMGGDRARSHAREPRRTAVGDRGARARRASTGRASAASSDADLTRLRACSAIAWRATRCSATTRWPRSSAAGGACSRTSASPSTTPRRCACSARRGRSSRTKSSGSTPTSCSTWSRKAPATFTLRGRNPERSFPVGGDVMIFVPVQGPPFVREGDVRRDGTFDDFCRFLKLAQVYDDFDTAGGLPCEPNDLPLDSRHLDMQRTRCMTLTDKPFLRLGSVSARTRADSLAHGRDRFRRRRDDRARARDVLASSTSTRRCATTSACSERCSPTRRPAQPVIVTPFLLMGAMSPVTIPAAIAQQTAEAFAGIALDRSSCGPARPSCSAPSSRHTDMQSGSPGFGGPESALGLFCTGQIARRYGLPWRSGGGALTSSQPRRPGGLRGAEHDAAGLPGGREPRDAHGRLAGVRAGVVLREVHRRPRDRCARCASEFTPLEVDEASLAFDAHQEVGHGGHFLGAAHTLERFRDCFYRPLLSSTENFERWKRNGGKDSAARRRRSGSSRSTRTSRRRSTTLSGRSSRSS